MIHQIARYVGLWEIINPVANDQFELMCLFKKMNVSKGYSNYEVFAFENNLSRSQYGQCEKGSDLRFTSLLRIMNAQDMKLEEFFKEGFDENAD